MIDTEMTLDQKIEESELKLFSGSAPIKSADLVNEGIREKAVTGADGRKRRKVVFADEDEDDDEGVGEDEEDDEGVGEDEEDEDESGSDDDDEETEKVPAKGKKKKQALKKSASSDSDDDDDADDDDDDDDDSDAEEVKGHLKKTVVKDGDSSEEDDDTSDESDSDNEAAKADTNGNPDGDDVDAEVSTKNKLLAREMGEDVSSDDESEPDKKRLKKVKVVVKKSVKSGKSKQTLSDEKTSSSNLSQKIRETLSSLGKPTLPSEPEVDETDTSDSEASSSEEVSGDSKAGDDVDDNDLIAWKSDLAEKASESFYERQSNVASLRKLVYGGDSAGNAGPGDGSDDEEIGGMFRIMSDGQAKKSSAASTMDQVSLSGPH